ncbi:MAG TPA: translocation/assembly module TamB domain-containing protein [Thermodesulfobacteriota bacterium]|nr:translocation/assembly module TamB domain-containing protein [Thermodesulfobacteriota bacterium]
MRSKVLKPIVVFLLLLLLLSVLVIIIIQTHYFRQFVKITTNAIVSTLTAQNFKIGGIEGNFLKGITLKNVSLDIGDKKFLDCEEIYIDYSLPVILDGSMLFSKVIPLHVVRVKGIRINLVHYRDDSWNFQELQKLMIKEKKPNPDWNIFILNGSIQDAKMTIEDEARGESSIFELSNADLSLNLFKIADKAEIDVKDAHLTVAYESMDFEKLYFENIKGKAVYSNKELPDKLEVTDVLFNYMGAAVTGKGEIIDMMNPRFSLNALISGIDIPGLGVLNAEVDARGNSVKWKDLHAAGKVKLADSSFMEGRLSGGIGSVLVENKHITVKKGNLGADVGDAAFEGVIDLHEIHGRGKNNTADFELDLRSLKVPRIIEILEKRNGPIEAGVNRNIDAVINSKLKVTAGWSRSREMTAGLDIKEMSLSGGGAGEIKLKGPLAITGSKIDYDLDAGFLNTNFAPIFNDQRYASDINSSLKIKGSMSTAEVFPKGFDVALRGEVAPSKVFDVSLRRGVIDATYNGASFGIKSLVLESGPFSVNASGDLGGGGGNGIKYDVDIKNLNFVTKIAPAYHLGGSLGLDGYIKGDLQKPRIIVNARGSDITYEEKRLRMKKVDLTADSYLDINDLRLTTGGEAKGIDIQGREIQLVEFKAASRGSGIDGTLDVQETVKRKYSLDFKLSELGGGVARLDLGNVQMNFENAVFNNRRPIVISLSKDRVRVDSFNLYHKENFVIGDLTFGFDESIDGSIKLEKLSLLDASELLGVKFPVKGEMSGEIKFGSSLKRPDLRADITARDLEYMEFKSDRLTLSVLFAGDKMGLDLKIIDNNEEILSAVADATIELDPGNMDKSIGRARYRAAIKSKGVDISPVSVFNEEIQELNGKLSVDLVAEGTGQDPNVSGRLELRDMTMKVLALRNKIHIDTAFMDMSGKYGTLRPVTIDTGEGKGVFEGRVDFRDLSYTGKGTMSNMLMQTYPADVTANLDGGLEVEGKFLNALIKGNITARNIEIMVPEKPLKEIESIKFIDEQEQDKDEFIYTGEKKEDFVEEFIALDLDVDIPRDSWVKGGGANIEVEGKLDINKSYKEPYFITGNIDVIRGDYQFMGRLFKIESGTVSFRGKKIIDPFLDLRATYEVSSVEVYINITGTAEKPKIQLSSDPPLDENEIVSYLVFGTSSDKLGTDERVEFQEKAGEVLGTMAVGELRDAIGDDLAIDVMTIKGGQTGFRDTHLEIGKYLTDDLYIGYERLSYERYFYERYFFSPGLPSSTVTANRAVIEYRVFDFLTLESEIGEEAGADVFFNFDY